MYFHDLQGMEDIDKFADTCLNLAGNFGVEVFLDAVQWREKSLKFFVLTTFVECFTAIPALWTWPICRFAGELKKKKKKKKINKENQNFYILMWVDQAFSILFSF